MKLRALLAIAAIAWLTFPLMADEEPRIQVTLAGCWSGKSQDGIEVSYSFTRDGAVVWRMNEKEFARTFPDGLNGKYVVRAGAPYFELDIYDFNAPWMKDLRLHGIVKFRGDRSFKMEVVPSNKGDRPRKFTGDAIVFQAGRSPVSLPSGGDGQQNAGTQ